MSAVSLTMGTPNSANRALSYSNGHSSHWQNFSRRYTPSWGIGCIGGTWLSPWLFPLVFPLLLPILIPFDGPKQNFRFDQAKKRRLHSDDFQLFRKCVSTQPKPMMPESDGLIATLRQFKQFWINFSRESRIFHCHEYIFRSRITDDESNPRQREAQVRTANPKKPVTRKRRASGYRWNVPAALAEKYFSREQAAVELGVSIRQLSNLIARGEIESIPYGSSRRLILKTSVRFYVAARTGDGLPPPQAKKAKGRGPRA